MSAEARAAVLRSLRTAVARLAAALAQPKTEWTRDAAIQRFEFSYELAWKAIARCAREEGVECASPRQALKAALRLGWIADDSVWLAMVDDRNRTSHAYDERMAERIYANLTAYRVAIEGLLDRLERAAG